MREIIHIECPDCGNRNYTLRKNKAKHKERLEIKKFCRHCRKHTVHKETK